MTIKIAVALVTGGASGMGRIYALRMESKACKLPISI
jgi:NAD(P)-dependent dehydrogenase (short-subunit alcohol dehydrogenase family)